MRHPIKFLAVLSVMILFYGCDSSRYQVVTGPDGVLYRFNKKTGELTMIMKDKGMASAAAGLQKTGAAEEDRGTALDKPVSWKESKYPGKDLKARFEMVWRENRLCYKFSVYPYKSLEKMFARKKQDYVYSLMRPGFTVELLDKNGFLVKEIRINLWNMTKVDGDDGTAKELVLNSQIDCTRQSYRSIGGYTLKWGLESEMIENDTGDYIKSLPIKNEE